MNIDTILSKMEEQRLDELSETQNETEPFLRPESSATYLHFRPGREPQQANRFTAFVLSVFKVTFCSLGLWGHQTWNYIPRVLFSAICIFPTVFWIFNFNRISRRDVTTPDICFTLSVSLAGLLSYIVFTDCFIAAGRKDSALVSPSETMMLDIQRTDILLLFLAFVFIIISFLSSWVLSLKVEPTSVPGEAAFTVQYLAHWASVTTCHVFAVSSFTLSKLLYLHIKLIAHKIGDSYMKVALLRLLGVTKIQDGGSPKSRIATTKEFC